MPKNSNFRLPRGHRFFTKKWKLRLWRQITAGTPRVHLGANGVPLGPKNWSKPWKITMPQISNFPQKMEVTVMAPNHCGDPLGSILGPMGSHWVQKIGQSHTKLPCPKIRIFDYPAVIDFSQKMKVTVMVLDNGGDPLGSILGPMGSHWVQKIGQSHKKLLCPKIRIFDYPAVIDFSQKMEDRFSRWITVGTP